MTRWYRATPAPRAEEARLRKLRADVLREARKVLACPESQLELRYEPFGGGTRVRIHQRDLPEHAITATCSDPRPETVHLEGLLDTLWRAAIEHPGKPKLRLIAGGKR